jgi:PilZ domain-containing protein
MLDFLKTMPSYSVDSVEIDGDEVAFLYPEALPVQQRAKVLDAEGGEATIWLESCRRNSGLWLHFGRIEQGCLQPTRFFSESVRRGLRLEVGLRVRSQQFPDYAAITNDVSERGVQLTLGDPLKVSSRLEFAVDFDDGSESLHLDGVVRWCQLNAPNRVGIQFVDVTDEQRTRLRAFLRDRAEPQLPGLPDSTPAKKPAVSRRLCAEVLDAFRQQECVAIRLQRGEETLEYRYTRPEVETSEMKVGSFIGKIDNEPLGDGLLRYTFYDDSGELLLKLVSGPPEITASAA